MRTPYFSRLSSDKRDVFFRFFSLSFCYIIVMSKQKRILSFFGRENKREENRPQTETSRTDNVDKDKLSDTDEREPLAEPKARAAGETFNLPGWKNSSGWHLILQISLLLLFF